MTVTMTIVAIPKAIGTPHGQPSGAVTPTNADWNSATAPALFNVPSSKYDLVTWVGEPVKMKVLDQFGNVLSSVYDHQPVKENDQQSGGVFLPINETITSGTYTDTVFFFSEQADPVAVGSPAASNWLNSIQRLPIDSPQSVEQDIQVQVAGFTLDPGIANRVVSCNNGTLTVTWP